MLFKVKDAEFYIHREYFNLRRYLLGGLMWTFTCPLLQVNVSFSIALLINSSLFPMQTHALCHFLSIACYAPGALPGQSAHLFKSTHVFFRHEFLIHIRAPRSYDTAVEIRGTGHGGFELFWSKID